MGVLPLPGSTDAQAAPTPAPSSRKAPRSLGARARRGADWSLGSVWVDRRCGHRKRVLLRGRRWPQHSCRQEKQSDNLRKLAPRRARDGRTERSELHEHRQAARGKTTVQTGLHCLSARTTLLPGVRMWAGRAARFPQVLLPSAQIAVHLRCAGG